jgi:hypothetical protein
MGTMVRHTSRFAEELRTPKSAAFAVLIGLAVGLLRLAGPASGGGNTSWLTSSGQRDAVLVAINLTPFAGIAFLWFIGVIRARLGPLEDKLFATVFLGSGLLFVSMLFAATAVTGALLVATSEPQPPPAGTVALAQWTTYEFLGTLGARMAAVFTLSVTTAGLRTGVIPRWLTIVGYTAGLVLLLSPPIPSWGQFIFPGWVLTLSLFILNSPSAAKVRWPTTEE